MTQSQRTIIHDGAHTAEVLNVLGSEIKIAKALHSITEKAVQIVQRSVDPIAGPPEHPSDGLLYGLIQSGKTSIITVAAAMAADNGFQCIVILTSDIDLLYMQTLERIRKALRGLSVLGKNDWRDATRFSRQLRTPPFVVVCSKNGSKLNSLLDAFKSAGARGLSTFIIDDEADQASLNTHTSGGTGQISPINEAISNFRDFFKVNTYLQVTATPQALFLQRPDHRYRPSFTVLSEPGPGYVGGEAFFGPDSKLLRYFDINDLTLLSVAHQPTPTGEMPKSLKKALCTFLIASTSRNIVNPGDGYAFLCHVSLNRRDHDYIVNLMDRFKEDALAIMQNPSSKQHADLMQEFKEAYDDLAGTQQGLPELSKILEKIGFFLRGANIKLINALSNEEIKLDALYNIFVGGNKLGRGVTIKNLLVSYYGRNPRIPNSDTVLQHARMYGYRQNELGITRLFLPARLADHFKLIHQMEDALRQLVAKYPEGQFEGLYISSPLRATRQNVLDPNSIGMYVAGGYCNPPYPLRTEEVSESIKWLDEKLAKFDGKADYYEIDVDFVNELIQKCQADPSEECELWDLKILTVALEKIKTLKGGKAYLRVQRGRNLNEPRRETQGFLSGGEEALVPKDAPTLFIYRLNKSIKGVEVWWPQIRFPEGNYVMAFSLDK